MLCFKLHKNQPVHDEFVFLGWGGAPEGNGVSLNHYLGNILYFSEPGTSQMQNILKMPMTTKLHHFLHPMN